MNKNPAKTSLLLFVILYGTMFLFGFIENIKGVSYPMMKAEFAISYEQQGVMVSILTLSYVLFCLVGGILIGRYGVKKTFAAGFVLMVLGLGGAFLLPRFISVAVALFLISASFGVFEVGINAFATQIFIVRAALLMNLLHFFYGVGSSVSPRASGVVAVSMGWRQVYLLSIPLVLLFFIFSLFTRFPKPAPSEPGTGETTTSEPKRISFFTALKTPMVWVFAIVLGLMVSVEVSPGNWGALYFQDVYHLDPKTSGAAFLSNFYIFFTVSRLVSGFVIEKIGYLRSLFIFILLSALVLVLGFALGARGIYVLPVMGFFVAVLWPTTMATAMGYFREDAAVMTSAIIVISGILNSGIQMLIGYVNRAAGPAWGLRSCLVYSVLAIIGLIVLVRRMHSPYKKEPDC